MPGFPVRLAAEIFSMCMEYSGKITPVSLYDPCCGSGYMLTVLGYIFPEQIKEIYASDINEEALRLADENLSLLYEPALLKRKAHIEKMINEFNKESHKEALHSIEKFLNIVRNRISDVSINCFTADILDKDPLRNKSFYCDIVMTDVPYGKMAEWSEERSSPIDLLLDAIYPVICNDSVIAVAHDKSQKISNEKYIRLEKIRTGKRQVDILRMKERK
jgi:23S rRNA (guanine2535-N1)-methyltransferase